MSFKFPLWLTIKHVLNDLGSQSQGLVLSKSSLLRTQLYCSRPIDNDNFHRSIKQLIKAIKSRLELQS